MDPGKVRSFRVLHQHGLVAGSLLPSDLTVGSLSSSIPVKDI